jgi:hypothetical protein
MKKLIINYNHMNSLYKNFTKMMKIFFQNITEL